MLLLAAGLTAGSLNAQQKSDVKVDDQNVGIGSDKVDGDYIGGLNDSTPVYSKVVTKKDFTVSDKAGLLKALAAAKQGQVVYVADNASIDLSGSKNIPIPGGVTLASGRGKNGSKGALLYTTGSGVRPLFLANGPGVRVTGLRIQGGDQNILPGKNVFVGITADEKKRNYTELYKKNMYATPVSSAINCGYPNLEVDNCELYGWTLAAVYLLRGKNAKVHHNYIHHNQRFGLGYGVLFFRSSAIVKGNLFDYNRHSVTGGGDGETSYEVCYNKFLEHHIQAWPIDMHGGADRKDGTNIAAKKLVIHHNLIRLYPGKEAVVVRGVPTEGAYVYNNDIVYLNKSVQGDATTGAAFVAEANRKAAGVKAATPDAGDAASSTRTYTLFESRRAAPAAAPAASQRRAAPSVKTAVQQRNAVGKMTIFDNQIKQSNN